MTNAAAPRLTTSVQVACPECAATLHLNHLTVEVEEDCAVLDCREIQTALRVHLLMSCRA